MELPQNKLVVVLCGGSNGNHVLAADLGRREDIEVRLITRNPSKWSQTVRCREQRFTSDSLPINPLPTWWVEYEGRLAGVYDWAHASEALQDAHVCIMVCPVSAHRDILRALAPHLPEHPLLLGTAYGQGGFDWMAREVLLDHPRARYITLFAMKHFPYLCKAQAYGQSVKLFGRYPDLRAAVSPFRPHNVQAVQTCLQRMFHKPITPLTDFVICTLGGTNQILHPSICTQLFGDWVPGLVYPEVFMFYLSVNANTAKWLFDLAIKEIPTIIWALDGALNRNGHLRYQATYEVLSDVISKLPTFAQPKTLLARPLMWALQWNKRLSEVKAPMVPEGSGFVPNVTSRFFTDDTAHGLCVLQGMAEILDVEMPRVLFLLRRLQHIMGKQYVSELPDARGRFLNGADVPETSAPQAYGVHSLPELLQFLTWNRDEDVVVGSHFLRLEPEYQPNTVEVVQARL